MEQICIRSNMGAVDCGTDTRYDTKEERYAQGRAWAVPGDTSEPPQSQPRSLSPAQPCPHNPGCNWAKGHCPVLWLGNKAERQKQFAHRDTTGPNAEFRVSSSFSVPSDTGSPFLAGLRAAAWGRVHGRAVILALFSVRGILCTPAEAGSAQYTPFGPFFPHLS